MKHFYTTEQFIQKAREIHGNKYDYSKVDYINSVTKIIIICKEHGEFKQEPRVHLSKAGCIKCRISSLTNTTEQFIQKAIEVHGNKYDYSKTNYINNCTYVTIICSKHGETKQNPNNHLKGKGCPKCAYESKISNEEFITRARLIHNNKFDYSKVDYINARTKVTIICPKHGKFEQSPDGHLAGNGCSICKSSKGELVIWNILTKHNIQKEQQYRIPEVADELYYDFYLPELNILIEYHGIQHYEYTPFLHRYDEDNLLKQKNRDDAVRYNARKWKYRYLEFNYKQLKYMTNEQFEEMILSKIYS